MIPKRHWKVWIKQKLVFQYSNLAKIHIFYLKEGLNISQGHYKYKMGL